MLFVYTALFFAPFLSQYLHDGSLVWATLQSQENRHPAVQLGNKEYRRGEGGLRF